MDAATHSAMTIVNELVSAWNVHDATAFAAPFHDDADFTNVFGMKATGREAIDAFHAPVFVTMFRDSTLEAVQVDARELRPDVIAVDLRWAMHGAIDPLGNPWPTRRGLMNLVCTNQSGTWGIAVMHNLDLPDEGMAEAQAALQAEAG
ncbi:MAG: SgcJ/EcaC family oxidoreductase [Thermoleophilia bacterium]